MIASGIDPRIESLSPTCGASSQTSGGIDRVQAERAVRQLISALGEDPNREGLQDTPRRVARMFEEICAGLWTDPAEHLSCSFTEEYDDVVLLRDINFSSLCEHHFLPFMGKAHVAYLPSDRVVGLSKLSRVVEGYAARPQIQERLTGQIADVLMTHAGARGAFVVIDAQHLCMKIRGVKNACSSMVTTSARGVFRDSADARREVLDLIKSC